ncbi:MAG: acyl-CoA dehydrogenase [Bradyrhizobium sp.]|nr:acyl-CoA dehydrogenase [Bradyrhizobium sp.]
MNFEFSEDSLMLREEARSFLTDKCGSAVTRRVLEGEEPYAADLWQEMAAMGWLGAAIPEEYGGAGLGYEILCVLAEEIGRAVAPVPFSSSIYLAAEALLAAGGDEQKFAHLPGIGDGSRIGTVALSEGLGRLGMTAIAVTARNGLLHGIKWPVPDGMIADFMIVAARDRHGIGLYHVDFARPGVERATIETIDPTRGQARVTLDGVKGERLAVSGDHWPIIDHLLDRAAILTAFEQIGGAEACLYMARDYAMDRIAFGRPLASFQAIKHKLADVFVELEIARSNAYYGAWALSNDDPGLALAAASARIAAIQAFRLAAKENIQTHGGAGFTWEFDCHLHYRRAQALALGLGGAPFWMDRLINRLEAPAAQQENVVGL